jgi:hypothetical protein
VTAPTTRRYHAVWARTTLPDGAGAELHHLSDHACPEGATPMPDATWALHWRRVGMPPAVRHYTDRDTAEAAFGSVLDYLQYDQAERARLMAELLPGVNAQLDDWEPRIPTS